MSPRIELHGGPHDGLRLHIGDDVWSSGFVQLPERWPETSILAETPSADATVPRTVVYTRVRWNDGVRIGWRWVA